MFGADAVAAVLPAVAIGWGVAGGAYGERHRRWMTAHVVKLTDGAGAPLVDAVLAADPAAATAAHSPAAAAAPAFDQLTIDHLPYEPDSPVFVTLAAVTGADNPKATKTRTAFRRRVLTADQARALAAAVAVPRAGFGAPVDERRAAAAGPAGRVFELPEVEAAGLLRPANLYRIAAVNYAPLLAAVAAGIGLGVVAYDRWADLDGAAAVVVGAAVGLPVAALVLTVRYEQYLPAVLLRRQLARAVVARPDPLVDPADPDVWFVDRVPRAHWGRVMLDNADEVGFLRLDAGRGLLLFEGDRERWVVPVGAVSGCEVEQFTADGGEPNAFNLHAAAVVRGVVDGAAWEAPLVPRNTVLRRWLRDQRRRAAEELAADIRAILPADPADG